MSDAPAATTAHGRRAAVRLIGPRTERVQICMTSEEKALAWEQARRANYENLSDFGRARMLGQQEGRHLDAGV